MTSSISFPPNSDYIGTESCIDLRNDRGFESSNSGCTSITPKSSTRMKKEKREFPPPIPLLSRTENLPWVLKRYCTNDGRLILKEEKVRHHEYFRAHRANGRLTLQLVPLHHDHDPMLDSLPLQKDEVTGKASSPRETSNNIVEDTIESDKSPHNEERNIVVVENEKSVVAANGPTKCLNFSTLGSGPSCIFEVPQHPIRTVHG